MSYLPNCPNAFQDCFAQEKGRCRILLGTKEYRRTRYCPFYQENGKVDWAKQKEDVRQYAHKKGETPIYEGWDE